MIIRSGGSHRRGRVLMTPWPDPNSAPVSRVRQAWIRVRSLSFDLPQESRRTRCAGALRGDQAARPAGILERFRKRVITVAPQALEPAVAPVAPVGETQRGGDE